jgi:hypothetical protein
LPRMNRHGGVRASWRRTAATPGASAAGGRGCKATLAEDLELQRALALRAVAGGLLRLRWLAAATRVELAMHRHMRALKYNADQPRVPRGNPDGGQWTGTDANGNPVRKRLVRLAGDVPTNDPRI